MTNKGIIILCASIAVLSLLGGVTIGYFAFKNEKGTVEIGPIILGPTEQTEPPSTPISKCKALIFEAKMNEDGKSIHIIGKNNCFNSFADVPINCMAPVYYKKYSLGIQLFMTAGYNMELKKIDAIVGGELFFLRNFKYGSIGLGVIYQQGLFIKQYYGGVAVLGKFDFGPRM